MAMTNVYLSVVAHANIVARVLYGRYRGWVFAVIIFGLTWLPKSCLFFSLWRVGDTVRNLRGRLQPG